MKQSENIVRAQIKRQLLREAQFSRIAEELNIPSSQVIVDYIGDLRQIEGLVPTIQDAQEEQPEPEVTIDLDKPLSEMTDEEIKVKLAQ